MNLKCITKLDGVADRISFVCSPQQIEALSKELNITAYTVRKALKLEGAPSTVASVCLRFANPAQPITLI